MQNHNFRSAENPESTEKAKIRKKNGYRPLIQLLKSMGYPEPKLIILGGGVRGWHTEETFKTLQDPACLGSDSVAIARVHRSWTHTAWHYAYRMLVTRRHLEHTEEFSYRSGLARWREFKAFDIIRKRKSRRR